jgi:hypothetical protein
MKENGMVRACSACAAQGGGSCCSPEVAQWYDPILLLINLLMRVTMPVSPEVPGHCRFVGSRGCKLVARYPFCVNYLCPGLRETLGPSLTREFSAVAGQELSCGWEVELAIQTWLRADP